MKELNVMSGGQLAGKILTRVKKLFDANNHVNSCELLLGDNRACDCGLWGNYVDSLLIQDMNKMLEIIKDQDDRIYYLASELEKYDN